jgi:hypothetical protein
VERIFLETQKDFFVWVVPSYICKRKSPTAAGKLNQWMLLSMENYREFIGKCFQPNRLQENIKIQYLQ